MSPKGLNNLKLVRDNICFVKKGYPNIRPEQIQVLRQMTREYKLSVARGDLVLLENGWFVTHSGLLRLAQRHKCWRIDCDLQDRFCRPESARWVFKATLFKNEDQSFVGYGDADPSNVSSLVRGAEMRVAETRAVNRALRKAYGIGICSVEEIGSNPAERIPPQSAAGNGNNSGNRSGNGNVSGNVAGPKVRDRLCQIIRQHKLDPELVKAYAVDFCGTKTLRDASRERVENFVQSLADWAEKDRNALLCQLNSYARAKSEVVA